MAEILQKVNRNEKSICGKCSHRFVCVGINNQPCFECNQFTEEVVRCKDCKKRYNPKECPMCVFAYGEQHDFTQENGYCDRGERKDNG